ncbi:Hypothetical predicted protein [Olea europaea subsp. europaea]|uniref:Uncharacterized protein n=1 Tax=Olea europaea subsp. europaea TaxID=158383 RepID=A0A8S0Q2F5_OLEEU|nr:Hypothetical predicted protein [Olea europaea subsp. europaea]
MGGEINNRRLPYFSGCMSPSCVTVQEEYSRIHISRGNNKGRRLRKLVRKIVNESKSIYEPSKPVTFQYDAVSYSQNFDEGLHKEDYPQAFQQFKCRVVNFFDQKSWRSRDKIPGLSPATSAPDVKGAGPACVKIRGKGAATSTLERNHSGF